MRDTHIHLSRAWLTCPAFLCLSQLCLKIKLFLFLLLSFHLTLIDLDLRLRLAICLSLDRRLRGFSMCLLLALRRFLCRQSLYLAFRFLRASLSLWCVIHEI